MKRRYPSDEDPRPALTLVPSLERQSRCAVCWGELERESCRVLTARGWVHVECERDEE